MTKEALSLQDAIGVMLQRLKDETEKAAKAEALQAQLDTLKQFVLEQDGLPKAELKKALLELLEQESKSQTE